MTDLEIRKLLGVLKATYPQFTLQKETPTAWEMALEDIGYADARAAVIRWIRTEKFFPTPAEIRGMLADAATAIEPWEAAWDEILACRKRHGLYIGDRWGNTGGTWSTPFVEQALRLIGGYEAVCSCEFDREPTIRAQFRDAYTRSRAAAVKRAQLGDDVIALPGNVVALDRGTA